MLRRFRLDEGARYLRNGDVGRVDQVENALIVEGSSM